MQPRIQEISRRELLRTLGSGFGMLGLAHLLGHASQAVGPLDVKPTHFPPRAKHVIFLFFNGGPSHIDTFDHKPMLAKYDGKPYPAGYVKTEYPPLHTKGNLMRSSFEFKKHGKSGIEVSEIFPKLAECIDDVCVIKSMHTDQPGHARSLFMLNCGQRLPGHPSMGAWLTYGLGTENQNLPGYIVMCPGLPVVGPQLWSSAYLPGAYQGAYIQNSESDPEKLVPYARNSQLAPHQQRRQVELLSRLNRAHLKQQSPAPQLEATIRSMEVAYRMQVEALDAFDIRKEGEATQESYGEGDFARGCLIARRLVERGVRMVQVYFGNRQPWDLHEDILQMRKLGRQSDQPIAALLRDLKSRGLLEETLVLIGGEFGRTPTVDVNAVLKLHSGRDHNPDGFSMVLAGGGIKGGMTYGNTDDFGSRAVENPVHVHDLHATVLHLMGLDHTRLTYRHSGRNFRLTDVGGKVIKDRIA